MTKKQRREHRKISSPTLTPVAAAVMAAVWPATVVMAQDDGYASDADQEEIEEIITTG